MVLWSSWFEARLRSLSCFPQSFTAWEEIKERLNHSADPSERTNNRSYFIWNQWFNHRSFIQTRRSDRRGGQTLLPLRQTCPFCSILQKASLQLADVGLMFHQLVWCLIDVLFNIRSTHSLHRSSSNTHTEHDRNMSSLTRRYYTVFHTQKTRLHH